MAKIRNVVVGHTISVYLTDDTKIATMKAPKLMGHLADLGQWTFTVERANVDGALDRVNALAAEMNAEVTVIGDTTFKFKVDKAFVMKAIERQEPKSYIRLGRDATFDSTFAAEQYVAECPKIEAPENMIVGLTKTFERGSVEGQIKSVFGDVFAYGMIPPVAAKVRDFAVLTGNDSRYADLRATVYGEDTEGLSTTLTFKYQYLIKLARDLPSAEAAPAEEVDVAA